MEITVGDAAVNLPTNHQLTSIACTTVEGKACSLHPLSIKCIFDILEAKAATLITVKLRMIANIGSFMLERRETMNNTQDNAKIDSSTTGETGATESSGASTPIPLPPTHVRRTESEVRLSDDQALAEEREIHMFYRLLHGIRRRQESGHGAPSVHLPGVLPPRVMDESPPGRAAAGNMFGWQMGVVPPVAQPMSQGSGMDIADSWSITGFDGHQASSDSRLPESITVASPTSPPDVCDEDGTLEEEDECIFAMDL